MAQGQGAKLISEENYGTARRLAETTPNAARRKSFYRAIAEAEVGSALDFLYLDRKKARELLNASEKDAASAGHLGLRCKSRIADAKEIRERTEKELREIYYFGEV